MRTTPTVHKVLMFASLTFKTFASLTHDLGWRQGFRLAFVQTFRSHPRTMLVSVPNFGTLSARVGRRQSDLQTLIDIWLHESYQPDGFELHRPSWIIDAGANAGFATSWFAHRYPTATVVAIEPDPGNVDVLRLNTARLTNVRIEQAALSDSDEPMHLIDMGTGPWGMRVGRDSADGGRIVAEVECMTVDTLMQRHQIDRIDLLKIDIEGGELEVFKSAGSWIDRVDAVATELHDRFRAGCSRAYFEATQNFGQDFYKGENHFARRADRSAE